ncbi:hypothetical protein [Otariodibacter oris]|uniref:Uncharacterized protein n=1 Tax=Otariodibacter oris TaxID=1032623 RepID=A0A420XJC0_9PAST|nr:hypothetical protein [Otariodibacter oris]RKR77238.1 hypothetical protein DES31_0565 [Otariodibacter oris]
MVVGVNVLSYELSAYVTDNSVYDASVASGIKKIYEKNNNEK